LHVEESLQCIDFSDHEPGMDAPDGNTLARCPFFRVDRLALSDGASLGNPDPDRFSILTVVTGELRGPDGSHCRPGDALLVPRGGDPLTAAAPAVVLQTTIPRS
ncbi:MAG: mannose-6-phosphate isomerase, partial [Akkermansiaceae bacterium]|nr:mannose-6-phosphate isomerase [Akkermansiaceae bacterium]